MRASRGLVVGGALALAATPGCRQILGIDDPAHDTNTAPDSADGCYGAELADGGLIKICQQPTISNLVVATNIDTDTEASCATVSPPLGPPVCVIEAIDIHVTGPIVVTGTRPLVLVASHVIEVASGAILDVSSKLAGVHGAGANDSSCPPASSGGNSSLGGGGGTFGTAGGIGGGGSTARATPVSVQFVRGGCPGFAPLGSPGMTSGASGGAVYLIAGTELAIAGAIIAGGGGGLGGAGPNGGGGGGAGGLIGLDAPTISGSGAAFAVGGGGGGGGNTLADGLAGEDASDKFSKLAKGGTAAANGGNGGNGAGYGNEAANGGSGVGAGMGGGGGGGGGAGIIWVRGTLELTRVSPTPSP